MFFDAERRAYTNPISNFTALTGVDLAKNLGSIVLGKYPKKCLPAFAHELTHHWCFNSPVGTAMAHLRLRARRNVLLRVGDEKITQKSDLEILEDMIRYDVASDLLRPLSEALALFAEFDVMASRQSRSMSVPFNWIYSNFTKPTLEELETDFGLSLRRLLCEMRTSEIVVRRKASVLLEPLLPDKTGGYLAGYMTLKNIFYALRRRYRDFADSELFFAFVHQYVYSDYELVHILLDSPTKDIKSAERICLHVQERINQLLTTDFTSDVAHFEIAMAQAKLDRRVHGPHVVNGLDLITAGHELVERIEDELRADDVSDLDRALRTRDHKILAQRDIMSIGRLECEVKTLSNGRLELSKNGRPLGLFPREGSPVEGACTIEVCISPSGFFSALNFYHANALIHTVVAKTLAMSKEEVVASLSRFSIDRRVDNEAEEDFERLLEAFFQQSYTAVVVETTSESVANFVQQLFVPRALSSVPDDKLEAVSAKMAKNGFADLLTSAEDLKCLAAVNLAASLIGDKHLVQSALSEPHSVDKASEISERLNEQTGLRSLIVADNQVISLI